MTELMFVIVIFPRDFVVIVETLNVCGRSVFLCVFGETCIFSKDTGSPA